MISSLLFSNITIGKIEKNSLSVIQDYKTMKQNLESNQQRKENILGLYEEKLIEKSDLSNRLAALNKEKKQLEERLSILKP